MRQRISYPPGNVAVLNTQISSLSAWKLFGLLPINSILLLGVQGMLQTMLRRSASNLKEGFFFLFELYLSRRLLRRQGP